MDYGLDYSFARPSVALLKSQGIKFVCRYLSWLPSGKVIGKSEYDSYKSAGIECHLNWEYDSRDGTGGGIVGKRNATEAVRQAKALGYPIGATIYFSTGDFDVFGEGKQTVCLQYDQEASKVVRSAGYRYGGYGSEEYLDLLWSNRVIDDGWQSPSTFGRRKYVRDSRNHLYQTDLDTTFYGESVDKDLRVGVTYSSLHVVSPSASPVSGPYIPNKTYFHPYEVLLDVLKFLPKPLRVTDTTRDLNGPIANGHWDYHVGMAAVDFAGTDEQMKANAYFLSKYSYYLTELIHTNVDGTAGYYVKNGTKVAPYAAAAHSNHVHVAVATLAGALSLLNRLKADFPYLPEGDNELTKEEHALLQTSNAFVSALAVGADTYWVYLADGTRKSTSLKAYYEKIKTVLKSP